MYLKRFVSKGYSHLFGTRLIIGRCNLRCFGTRGDHVATVYRLSPSKR